MSETSTKPKLFCFVLMPFDGAFDDVYQLGIKAACDDAGAYCERVDEQIFQERILDRIYNQIAKADVVIADMTGRNPNVFYEVGYAHALGRPTVLLTRNADDIPFDLKHFPHIVYESKLTMLKEALTKRVRWHVENPSAGQSDSRNPLDLYLSGRRLSGEGARYEYAANSLTHVILTVHNASSQLIDARAVRVGMVVTRDLERVRSPDIETTHLPDGRVLHLLPAIPQLFPDQYKELQLVFLPLPPIAAGIEMSVVVRVFTPAGKFDYPISLVRQEVKA